MIDKESIFELQKIDCNCNDCKFMIRDLNKLELHKLSYKGTGLMDNLNYGYCNKLNKDVTFIPNVCQSDTQECFTHRKTSYEKS